MTRTTLTPLPSPPRLRFETVVDLASGVVVGADVSTAVREFVLDEACGWARVRSTMTDSRPTVWVELPWPDAERVGGALRRSGLPSDQLVVQLSEPVLNRRGVYDAMVDLKELGVHLAVRRIDRVDVSLRRLHGLPVDILRFTGAEGTPALLRRAQELGLVLHADGVDDAAGATRLLDLGCDLAQGALFG